MQLSTTATTARPAEREGADGLNPDAATAGSASNDWPGVAPAADDGDRRMRRSSVQSVHVPPARPQLRGIPMQAPARHLTLLLRVDDN